MKKIKKSLSVILAVLLAFSCISLTASAITIDGEEIDHLPQVYVMGFESLKIYDKNDPDKTSVFPVNYDILLENLSNFTDYAAEALKNGNYNLLHHYIYSAFYDTLSYYAFQGDGVTPLNENIVCEERVFEHDGDGLYYFPYDSRLSPVDIAKQLNEFIKMVQEHSGSERFELVGASYGGNIVIAYLNEYPEMHQYIDSCLLSVPSYGGFSILSELFSGDFYIDHDTLTQYAYVGMNNEDLGLLLSVLNKSGFLELLLELCLVPGAKALLMDTAREFFHDVLATIPSYWSFIQEEYFYDAMKNIYGENYADPDHEYAGLISKVTYYQEEIMQRLDEIYLKTAENGVKMNIICKYGRPPMPFTREGSFQSDGSVDVKDVTLGAVASKYGETLPEDYEQALYPEYNFISPDKVIDASTGIDPIHTWYVRGLEHGTKTEGFIELINYIVYEDPTVFTSDEFPQFTYAAEDGSLVPVTEVEDWEETSFFTDYIRLIKRILELAKEAIRSAFDKILKK